MNGEDRITAKKAAGEVLPAIRKVKTVLADRLVALQYLHEVVDKRPGNQCGMETYQLRVVDEQLRIIVETLCQIS